MESKKIEKGDFIQIDYTGKLKEGNIVFDTTLKEVAEKGGLNAKAKYKPVTIRVGDGYILPALEEGLIGKTAGKYTFDLAPENAFGKKSAKLLKLVPTKMFKQQDIVPYVGLEVNIDNMFGIVRTVSGGRIIVDFNHPLSGRDVSYEIEVKKMVTDDKEKLEAILAIASIRYDSISVNEGKALIVLEHEVPKELRSILEENAKKQTGITSFEYVVKKKPKQ